MRAPVLRIIPLVCVAAVWLSAGAPTLAQSAPTSEQPTAPWLDQFRDNAQRLIQAATADDFAWRRLAEMTDTYGARLAGSRNLTRAVAWAAETMKADGLENVRTERVMVPHWVRGRESAQIIDPPHHEMAILGLGGTAATPPGGVAAEVLPVDTFDDLQAKGDRVRGRIVLFNAPFTNYSETVAYRNDGARAAAKYGAVAVLVRSVGPTGLRTAHTGSVLYVPGERQIPAASIAAEDANRIVRLIDAGRPVRVRLVLEDHYAAEAESANVIGEIRGREKPDEIVLLGGHLDSWDVGAGASDDGVGCIVTWEAARLMKKLSIRPRRTVRVVLWTNEENGLRGASAYGDKYAAAAKDHVFALESDSGVFAPSTLGFSGSPSARGMLALMLPLLKPLGFTEIGPGGGGADIGPIAQAGDVPTMAYLGDSSRYFVIHHSAADTVERILPDDVSTAAAAIAAVTYVVAEMPDRLPH